MTRFRRVAIAALTIAALAAASPAFAQSGEPLKIKMPTFKTIEFVPGENVAATKAVRQTRENEQGLGFFVQGGWVRVTQRGGELVPSAQDIKSGMPGFLFGLGFGGNKSGHFGIGADVEYYVVGSDVTFFGDIFDPEPLSGNLKLHYLQVPVYGRITFFGTSTKNAPSLYALIGGFVDILLKASLQENINVKDSFNGFDAGVIWGLGFEVARLGIEGRFKYAMTTLQSTGINHNGQNTFLNGLEDSKKVTFVLLLKIRIN